MNTIKVCCVDSGDNHPYSLVFDIIADYDQNVLSWDMHSGHGAAQIDWVEHHKQAPNDVAQKLLEAYTSYYAGWSDHTPEEYVLVSIDEFVNHYWEA